MGCTGSKEKDRPSPQVNTDSKPPSSSTPKSDNSGKGNDATG